MMVVLRQGGLVGGLNFDAKPRRESTDMQDLFIAHIGGMDAFARGLEVAHALLTASPWEKWRRERYASFEAGAGKDFESGQLTLADLATMAAKNGEPAQISGRQERYENLLNQYLFALNRASISALVSRPFCIGRGLTIQLQVERNLLQERIKCNPGELHVDPTFRPGNNNTTRPAKKNHTTNRRGHPKT